MNFILWIIFGGLAGWVASLLVGADARIGVIGNITIGIVGAFVSGWIADRMGAGGAAGAERPSSLRNFIVAVIGAVVILLLINLFF